MNFYRVLIAATAALYCASAVHAAATAEEAKQLGANLTLFGAEKAGNKDGTIPEYTGGLPTTTSPPGFVKGSGKWTSPYASEKPLFSITAQNVDKYADKLSEASKALLKRYPSYRMDVYPTHRSMGYPKWFLDTTVKNATTVSSIIDGLAPVQAVGGIPFPIPKTGYDAVWNHLLRFQGPANERLMWGYYVDASGKPVLGQIIHVWQQGLYNVPGMTLEQLKKKGYFYFQSAVYWQEPPRTHGDGTLFGDTISPPDRRTFSYSASTRRVRLAPDVAYDTPITSAGGVPTYDSSYLFSGRMDRFDFKLVGKKEMYIPYNNYDYIFANTQKLLTPKHFNPDLLRWELHRVWIVEATLKPGLRHIYSKYTLYLDEDHGGGGTRDDYDSSGKLYKGIFMAPAPMYDVQGSLSGVWFGYDLSTGTYFVNSLLTDAGYSKVNANVWEFPSNTFSPDQMAGRSSQ